MFNKARETCPLVEQMSTVKIAWETIESLMMHLFQDNMLQATHLLNPVLNYRCVGIGHLSKRPGIAVQVTPFLYSLEVQS